MRELISMFSDHESRDELGLGRIRDTFGDLLFPGSSTQHTRARYLLIVPWCIQHAARRRTRDEARELDRIERRVIVVLRDAGETEGLIGRTDPAGVTTLPSAVYRSALRWHGIDRGVGPEVADDPTEELSRRAVQRWPATLPQPPSGFPDGLTRLRLSPAEASWLRDQLLLSAPDSLLAHLLRAGNRPNRSSTTPWQDPATRNAPPQIAGDLAHARHFSTCMYGAVLLYNLLLAEDCVRHGFNGVDPAAYQDRLVKWADTTTTLRGWDPSAMWYRLIDVNPRIAADAGARRFVNAWAKAVLNGRAGGAAVDKDMRALVAGREFAMKGSQSRLGNSRRLETWTGASGTGRMVFRWPQVRRMVIDIHDGLEARDAAATG
ncbi:DUF6361 family protein [Actinoplanes sp. TRM 88003]|uniref:DUF6361 family protein n=2 Tax=Paractinoplanes aksuensis TaxID=2939490 RepID=A0ABT1E2A6_9ACTN|nr:DUF6361 family protein [Actinoplanes aksuensis]